MLNKKFFIIIGIVLIISGGSFSLLKKNKIILIEGLFSSQKNFSAQIDNINTKISSISGLPCQNYNRRPIAVVLAEDDVVRPLSGISLAELVIEMPVLTGQINRMMAVYVCESPSEIGSIRSARHDFIPLAQGLDAIFAHWGGSHFALDLLNKGIIDNIDALPNPYNAFYRKTDKPAPHNGFTSMDRLLNAAKKLNYRLENRFEGYSHLKSQKSNTKGQMSKLEISYPYPFNIRYEYDSKNDSFLRWRGGKKEIDKLTGKQVEVKNIVIMRAKSRQIEGDYNDVDIEGQGEAVVYRLGEEIKGTWRKDKNNPASKLYFLDKNGKEIKFASGNIWIEIVEPTQEVRYNE